MEVVVHLRCGRPAASADALYFFERKNLVRRGFFVADAQPFFTVGQKLVAAAQHATDVGAYLYMVLAVRLGMHQRVVTDDITHVEFCDPDAGSHFADHRVGQTANLILGIQQHGNECGSPHGVDRHQVVEARSQGGTEDGFDFRAHDLTFSLTTGGAAWSRSAIQSIAAVSSALGPAGKTSAPCSSIWNSPTSSQVGRVTFQLASPVSG